MPSSAEWQIAPSQRPKAKDYSFDLERALGAMVSLHAIVPADAMTAEVLGTERGGNGVFIRDGIVLTIGYLVTEAETIWMTLNDGRVVPGHTLAFDNETGFGLVQALARVDVPTLELGRSADAELGERVVVAGAGGVQRSVAARIAGKQEFAGYWEYVLDEALFTAPAHPNWGGTALIDHNGYLIGIGSLQLEQSREKGKSEHLNMMVPTDLLKPILDDLIRRGAANRPVRPWLGIYTTEIDDKLVIAGVAGKGPAKAADVQPGDVVVAVAGTRVSELAEFYRSIWALGAAGVEVPLTVWREGEMLELRVRSTDRTSLFKTPRLH
ncbi:MAG: S1C family serine protease [Pseudorhodoplanes sp.]